MEARPYETKFGGYTKPACGRLIIAPTKTADVKRDVEGAVPYESGFTALKILPKITSII